MMRTELHFENIPVDVVKDKTTQELMQSKINSGGREDKEDSFFLCDLGDIVRKHEVWQDMLPRVKPYYAVKCNDDRLVLSLLHRLGLGFDCASKAEIQKVLDVGAKPEEIIYANPCKQPSHIRFAHKTDVQLMTFDNEAELHKVKHAFPSAKLVLRILPPATDKVQCPLGMKFGADPEQAPHLLTVAKSLDLDVVGVSFHVGSGCYDANVYHEAVKVSKRVFGYGAAAGYAFSLLDIGGGFPGSSSLKSKSLFKEISKVLRVALDEYFPEESGVDIIAEPGRFFVASAFTLATNIIAKRVKEAQVGNEHIMYYINDGVYGSFNCILYDHNDELKPTVLAADGHGRKNNLVECSVWGPTCDGLDCVNSSCLLPDLDLGSWLLYTDMGAYTCAAASEFNGMPKPKCYYAIHDHVRSILGSKADLPKSFWNPTDQVAQHLPNTCPTKADVF